MGNCCNDCPEIQSPDEELKNHVHNNRQKIKAEINRQPGSSRNLNPEENVKLNQLKIKESNINKNNSCHKHYFQTERTTIPTKESPNNLKEKQNLSSSQYSNRSRTSKKENFLQSREYLAAQSGNKDIEALLKVGSMAYQLRLLKQSRQIYEQALSRLEGSQRQYNPESVQNLFLHIHLELLAIAIDSNDYSRGHQQFLRCRQYFKGQKQVNTLEEEVVTMNNYAVLCKNANKYEQAINIFKEALLILEKYFLLNDERRYINLINLASCQFQAGKHKEGKITTEKILWLCPRQYSDIRQLAISNRDYFEKERR